VLGRSRESAALLMEGGVDFEFRTTVVRELHAEEDIRAIGEWLAGGERFYLQSFRDSGDIITAGLSPYSDEEMERLAKILQEKIPLAAWRG